MVTFLKNVYARPAPSPPKIPEKAGIASRLKLGFATNIAPKNAIAVIIQSNFLVFSFNIKKLAIIAKKGPNLFNILASAIFI